MKGFRVVSLLAAGVLATGPARAAADVATLSCIEDLFSDERAMAMADIGSTDPQKSAAAQGKVDFLMLGMASRLCAKRHDWSENQYFGSIGYVLAWPTMRGLQLQGAAKGFAAIERAWAAHARDWTDRKRLEPAEINLLLAEARADGLAVPAGDPEETNARRYADVLQQVSRMRANFAANRDPRKDIDR